MKILRGGVGQRDKIYSKATLKDIDTEQCRRRISGAEVDAYIGLATASSLLDRSAPVLERLAKETGNAVRIRQAAALIDNAVKKIGTGVSAEQLITVVNNCRDVTITISASPVEMCCNIDWRAMQIICNAAMEGQCKFCDSTRQESRDCALRKALEMVPGVKHSCKGNGADECPIAGKEMEWVQ